jgi:hypothetical protein
MSQMRPEILPPEHAVPKQRQRGGRIFALASFCVFGLIFAWHERNVVFKADVPVAAETKTYYLSPDGLDSNNGLSSNLPWLSPNHPLNCGDVIVAAASSAYSAANFYTGKWGTVNCVAGNKVAWLKCAIFDGCKIHTVTNQGMWVDRSYWGVQGWEITTSASDTYGTCFIAQPNYDAPAEIHHIIFANDIANGCSQGGFAVVNHGAVGVDYFAIVGSIAYNAAQGSASCASGISIYQPVQADTLPGTHIYVAGNFSYGNLEPSKCNGGSPTDGGGIIFDSFDGGQSGIPPYGSQAVAYNNIVVNNGSKGISANDNSAGTSHATIWFIQNTSWGNLTDSNQAWFGCAEVSVYKASDTHINGNLISTRSATGCGGHPIYALAVSSGDATDTVTNNLAYGYSGNHVFLFNSGSFAWGADNQFGTPPGFINPIAPNPPGCGGSSNVTNCMTPVIANFAIKTPSTAALGYQKPSSAPGHDTLFPEWLCTANVPPGLITLSCD